MASKEFRGLTGPAPQQAGVDAAAGPFSRAAGPFSFSPSRARFMSMRPLMRMSSPTDWLDTHPSKGLNLLGGGFGGGVGERDLRAGGRRGQGSRGDRINYGEIARLQTVRSKRTLTG